ncbi:MAG: glycosyltransferase family 4 protein [bacterium]
MRVGIDATCLPSALAGAGRYIHGVVQGLAGVDRQNEYFIFIKKQHVGQFEYLPENMQLVPLPDFSRPLRLTWQHFLAGGHAHRLKLDVWHGMHYTLPAFTRQMTTIATFHDLGVHIYPHFYAWSKRLYFRQAIAQTLHAANHLLTVSEATGSDLIRWLAKQPDGPRQPLITAISSGVEEKFFTRVPIEERARARQAHGLAGPYVLFVGTLEKRKNLITLLQAFQLLRQRGCDDHLLALAGQSDNGSAAVHEAIARLGLQERVRLLGYVPEADLPALYQEAALFALPSFYEGFGFPLLEAMAGGVVVLAANNSSLRELAAHPHLLCEGTPTAWADKMERLLFDEELRHWSSAYARDRARAFSWRKTAEQIQEIYETHNARMRSHPRNGRVNGTAAAPKPASTELLHSLSAAARKGLLPAAGTGIELQEAVRSTLAYADLFDYPLALYEIHYGLFGVRATLAEIRQATRDLKARGEIGEKEGYYFLAERSAIVTVRQQRRTLSRELLDKNRRWLRLVQNFPFVRGVAISGAMAFQNCKPGDDIDLFLVIEKGRLWTVYSGLVAVLKLFGKRRLLCLNCLVDTEHLRFDDQDLFVAHQIGFLKPLSGAELFQQFFRANAWCRRYLPQIEVEARLRQTAGDGESGRMGVVWGSILENLLRRSWFSRLESFVYRRYRRRIARLTRHLHPQAVVAARGQIKLFTNNHRFQVQHQLAERLQEFGKNSVFTEQENDSILI